MNLRKKFNEKELGILNRIAIDQARKEKFIADYNLYKANNQIKTNEM